MGKPNEWNGGIILKSQFDVTERRLLDRMDLDMALTVAWLEDTLTPAIAALNAKSIIGDILADVFAKELAIGKTEKSEAFKLRLYKALDALEEVAKCAQAANTCQLAARHLSIEFDKVKRENEGLKAELKAIEQAWKAE